MHRRSTTLPWLLILYIGALSLLSACGQKGPLYLPPEEKPGASAQVSGS